MARAAFDLRDEEGLEFEARPDLFVLLDRDPIVWSIRGIRYFSPRFERLGIDIGSLTTAAQFRAALRRWDALEWQFLVEDVEARAASGENALAHQCLWGILTNHPEVESMIVRLQAESQATSDGAPRP